MVCGPALLQGLVPPSQGSKAGAKQTPGLGIAGSRVGPHCPLTLQSPITSLGPYSPKLTLIPSFLCKQLNKLFSDRQIWVWVLGRNRKLSLGFCSFSMGTWPTVHTGVPSSTKKRYEKELSNSFYTVVYFTTHIHICLYTHIHFCSRPVPPVP